MKKMLRLTIAVAAMVASTSASAYVHGNSDKPYKDHVIAVWCKHVPVINLLVFDCDAY